MDIYVTEKNDKILQIIIKLEKKSSATIKKVKYTHYVYYLLKILIKTCLISKKRVFF